MTTAIRAEALCKRYRGTQALRDVDLSVPAGTVLGLLGPNGAGKTTTVRILATLLEPDSGHVEVAGFDAVRQPREVRRRIGLAGQYAAVDELLTGRENLVLIGTLLHLGRAAARRRAAELLEVVDLTAAGDRPVGTYSGGMRRRLDLASCLVGTPDVLFLDEPTTGLDPVSRMGLWSAVRDLVAGGVTVLLTTQYLEEADHLADQIVVVDAGQVIASGTPNELKRRVGDERLEITLVDPADLPAAVRALSRDVPASATEAGVISLPVEKGLDNVASAAQALLAEGVPVSGFALRRPTLDDVFLQLTGDRSS